MMRQRIIILVFCFQSCGIILGVRSDSACIQNKSKQPIIINTSPSLESPQGFWEKFWQCPMKDSINENGNLVYYEEVYLRADCVIKIENESLHLQCIKHDRKNKRGSYIINKETIFYLGQSKDQVWPHKKAGLKPADLLYDSIQIIIPFVDTIQLVTKQQIFNFLTSSGNTFNKKIDTKINKKYSTIAVIR